MRSSAAAAWGFSAARWPRAIRRSNGLALPKESEPCGRSRPENQRRFRHASHVELLKRSEVTAAIICTDEHLHVDPIMTAVERGIPMLIEKPLATDLKESARSSRRSRTPRSTPSSATRSASAAAGWPPRKNAVPARRRRHDGHLARIHEPARRHRQLQAHRRSLDDLSDGDIGHARSRHLHVVPGRKNRGRCYARSVDKVLGPSYKGIDGTAGMIIFSDGTIITSTSRGRCQ